MPCYKSNTPPAGFTKVDGPAPYATEAECLQACKEGACCNGTTCTVKPQCQCNSTAGEVFKGVGTTCSPNPCGANCYRQNGYRAVLHAQAAGLCVSCAKSKLVGFFQTHQEASDALAAYRAQVLADPACVIQSEQIVPLEITAACYESAPNSTWTLKSSYQYREDCQAACATDTNCPRGICIKVSGDCFCRDCPNNPNTLVPCPCLSDCGKGTYYEWECYKFAPGETIADYQWAVDDHEGYEVDWCTGTYFNAFHFLYMPVDKCPADAAQYWPDISCALGCRQTSNPLP